jgi:hypothetical protein
VTAQPWKLRPSVPWRRRLHELVLEADTAAGRAFDLALVLSLLALGRWRQRELPA